MNKKRIIKYSEAIKEATDQGMTLDRKVFIIGLGIPNGMGGTSAGLKDKYPDRVFDAPTSEASYAGMSVGAAISGLHPVVHFDRVEFSLLASDQMFTQASKWNYMFGGSNNVPIVFRITVGRQWGNGPQHSQAFYSMFGSVMGLKVIIPSTPYKAKGLLMSALKEKSPVVILEPRWLLNIKQHVDERPYIIPINKADIERKGKDLTIVAYGDGLFSVREALNMVGESIKPDLIDIVSINPVDHVTISKSVKKTGRLLCVDTTSEAFSIGSEIISKISKDDSIKLKSQPLSVACPNVPCPTSSALAEFYYPTKIDIANAILKMFKKPMIKKQLSFEEIHMAPQSLID